jgi:hypothetical protein
MPLRTGGPNRARASAPAIQPRSDLEFNPQRAVSIGESGVLQTLGWERFGIAGGEARR